MQNIIQDIKTLDSLLPTITSDTETTAAKLINVNKGKQENNHSTLNAPLYQFWEVTESAKPKVFDHTLKTYDKCNSLEEKTQVLKTLACQIENWNNFQRMEADKDLRVREKEDAAADQERARLQISLSLTFSIE